MTTWAMAQIIAGPRKLTSVRYLGGSSVIGIEIRKAMKSRMLHLKVMSVAEIETKREHENFFTTTYHSLVNWARKSSLWPYPFGTACCAIEFMATVSSHYDIARFGSEVVRFSPKQSDVLMVLGTINDKMGPVLKQIYDQMAEPKWVINLFEDRDRKSTRLNSSHTVISYAVFCLKKKNK